MTDAAEQEAEGHPPTWAPADPSRIFQLESHGPDIWVGESPAYPWGRIYGGLVIAQSLWAAMQTVVEEHLIHSLHGYFILGGDPAEPVRYEVDRIRNGRSFTTRRVVARQSGGAIFNLSCSFQRIEEGVETQTARFPDVAPPTDESPRSREGSGVERVDAARPAQPPRSLAWLRFPAGLDDDPRVHACALAYLSDSVPMDAVVASHPRGRPLEEDWHQTYMLSSLDHAMWFHRPARADDWLLLDMDGHGIIRTRGLSTGQVFDPDGHHVATVAQEGLIRELKARP